MIAFFQEHSYLFSQIFGFSAMATAIAMYQFKKHRTVMLLMVLCSSLWCFHYAFLGLLTPIMLNLVNVVRNFVCSFRDKKWCKSPLIPAFFIVASFVLVALTWTGVKCILPLIASVFATLACWTTDAKKLRYLTFPVCIGWFAYNTLNGSIAGMANETFTLVSIIVALVRFYKQDKINKTE